MCGKCEHKKNEARVMVRDGNNIKSMPLRIIQQELTKLEQEAVLTPSGGQALQELKTLFGS